ncbi:TniB family NTP-binding protein [Acinetobacter sp. ANC 3791]|uniref:TniB family NTP-binding protein n=1 Tax=Acinetobacter sp. ANC 3791 TaxID=2529836 RepID=UPI0010395E3E|nr:TniB family NTP-binding protein [Acinetobacter sp. ANC 3791]TCB84212.1 AAA family ATPase [Acinetobacter sp. ANC 3791]
MNNYTYIQTLSKLRNFVCHHSDFSNALNAIEESMKISQLNNQAVGCLLLGAGGVGKSTICKLIKNRYKPHKLIENNMEKLIVPAFYFPVPSPITIKSLAVRMLEELGCTDHKGTSEQLNYRLRILLKECKTQLIMLDEFHHIYNSSAQKNKSSENVANWIKTLADETKISICLVGLPSIQDNLFIDSQLTRRFSRVLKLSPLTLNANNYDAGTLQPFLKQTSLYLSKNFNIEFDPKLISNDLIKRIFLATSGYQAYVMQLIYHSCLNALENHRLVVLMSDFHAAYALKSILYKSMTKKEIFQISSTQVNEILI